MKINEYNWTGLEGLGDDWMKGAFVSGLLSKVINAKLDDDKLIEASLEEGDFYTSLSEDEKSFMALNGEVLAFALTEGSEKLAEFNTKLLAQGVSALAGVVLLSKIPHLINSYNAMVKAVQSIEAEQKSKARMQRPWGWLESEKAAYYVGPNVQFVDGIPYKEFIEKMKSKGYTIGRREIIPASQEAAGNIVEFIKSSVILTLALHTKEIDDGSKFKVEKVFGAWIRDTDAIEKAYGVTHDDLVKAESSMQKALQTFVKNASSEEPAVTPEGMFALQETEKLESKGSEMLEVLSQQLSLYENVNQDMLAVLSTIKGNLEKGGYSYEELLDLLENLKGASNAGGKEQIENWLGPLKQFAERLF